MNLPTSECCTELIFYKVMSYLSPVANEISFQRRQICGRVLHGYFHPMATLSYIGHLFKLEGDVVPQDDSIFLPQNRQ